MTTDALTSAGLFRLQAWLSPSFPVGAFSYSHGLEWLVETKAVHDETSLLNFVGDLLALGSGWSDAILFIAAHDAARAGDLVELAGIAELSAAFCPSAERYLETAGQGRAFVRAIAASWKAPTFDLLNGRYDGEIAYPVAVAIAAADHGIPLDPALLGYLHAFAANIVSAGLRLIPLGQTSGQRVTLAIEDTIVDVAERARFARRDDICSGLMLGDIASMLHETQYSRLFRS